MTHASRSPTTSTNASVPVIAQLLREGFTRCTSDSWTVKAIDTRPQAYSENDQPVFEAILQHNRGATIQVEPVPTDEQSSDDAASGYTGEMRVRLQREDGSDGKYVRLQGRAASLNSDRPVARTLLFYADGVDHPRLDQWTGFEDVGAVHVADDIARAVTYPSLTEVIIAVLGAANSVEKQRAQVDLSTFA